MKKLTSAFLIGALLIGTTSTLGASEVEKHQEYVYVNSIVGLDWNNGSKWSPVRNFDKALELSGERNLPIVVLETIDFDGDTVHFAGNDTKVLTHMMNGNGPLFELDESSITFEGMNFSGTSSKKVKNEIFSLDDDSVLKVIDSKIENNITETIIDTEESTVDIINSQIINNDIDDLVETDDDYYDHSIVNITNTNISDNYLETVVDSNDRKSSHSTPTKINVSGGTIINNVGQDADKSIIDVSTKQNTKISLTDTIIESNLGFNSVIKGENISIGGNINLVNNKYGELTVPKKGIVIHGELTGKDTVNLSMNSPRNGDVVAVASSDKYQLTAKDWNALYVEGNVGKNFGYPSEYNKTTFVIGGIKPQDNVLSVYAKDTTISSKEAMEITNKDNLLKIMSAGGAYGDEVVIPRVVIDKNKLDDIKAGKAGEYKVTFEANRYDLTLRETIEVTLTVAKGIVTPDQKGYVDASNKTINSDEAKLISNKEELVDIMSATGIYDGNNLIPNIEISNKDFDNIKLGKEGMYNIKFSIDADNNQSTTNDNAHIEVKLAIFKGQITPDQKGYVNAEHKIITPENAQKISSKEDLVSILNASGIYDYNVITPNVLIDDKDFELVQAGVKNTYTVKFSIDGDKDTSTTDDAAVIEVILTIKAGGIEPDGLRGVYNEKL